MTARQEAKDAFNAANKQDFCVSDQVSAFTAMLAETPDSLRVWLRELRDNRPARYRKLFAHCTPLEADALSVGPALAVGSVGEAYRRPELLGKVRTPPKHLDHHFRETVEIL